MSDLEIAYTCGEKPVWRRRRNNCWEPFVIFPRVYGLRPSFIPKAQKELDAVVGPDRMPTFEDFDDLPFIRAIVAETLRWRPVPVLGIPHASTEDFIYRGMFIPKGSIIIANLWESTSTRIISLTLTALTRRDLCRSATIRVRGSTRIARILWAFDLSKACDENGKEIDVDTCASAISTPRSPGHLAIIERENEAAQEEMKAYDS
ncbi:cytochrome P450 [Mycena leptocephala]|nr:cytochrome P450 [Mycena leptocephala]